MASIKTGWAVLYGGELIGYGLIKASGKLPRRLVTLYEEVGKLIDQYKPDVLVIEDPFYNKGRANAMAALFSARGVVLMLCQQKGLQFELLRASSVKLRVAGHGHADKEEVIEAIYERFNERLEEDIADAIALGISLEDET